MRPLLADLSVTFHSPPAWLLPYVPLLERILDQADAVSDVAGALNGLRGDAVPVRFIEHDAKPADEAYEAFVARTGCVPTRNNLHDLFNGLIWLTWPQTKRQLNRLQAHEIAAHGTPARRGPLRDALTLFDENAALLQAPPAIVDALRDRDWTQLFVTRRKEWDSARLILFGHALLEKLLVPRKAVTAHVWLVGDLSDDALAASLDSERLIEKPFLPLPVLGVPGWWKENEHAGFYDDPSVFRPRVHR